MAELLTRAIVEEYRKRAKALPDTAGQVGAPYSRVMDDEMGTERDTFPTFERVEKGIYRFCGNCFAGETKHIE